MNITLPVAVEQRLQDITIMVDALPVVVEQPENTTIRSEDTLYVDDELREGSISGPGRGHPFCSGRAIGGALLLP